MTNWENLDATGWREKALEVGPRAGIEACLRLIDERNPRLNAFTIVLREQALADSDALDASNPGPLFGVPVCIKEEIDVAGCVTTFGTRGNSTPKAKDSEVVRRLRDAGAIIVGKTAMPAFGAFPFTESDATGITVNPLDPSRSPGGSSGGTAAAVAGGLVPVGLGGDGGGSIRIPSAHCGLVGLKPRRGVIPSAPYEDLWGILGTSGALTKSARDARLLFDILSDVPAPQATAKKLRIVVDTTPSSPLTPPHKDHLRAVDDVVKQLRSLGHEVVETKVKTSDPTPAFIIQFLDGIRTEIAGLEHPERIEARHKRTKAMGFWVNSKVLDWAKKKSEDIGAELDQEFADFDLLLTPTVATRPAKAGILTGKGTLAAQIASLGSVAYTAKYNVSGHPAIAIPTGIGTDGLPVSVQFVAVRAEDSSGESLLIHIAEQLGA